MGKYCGSHKLDGMADVLYKLCEYPGCGKHRPTYNDRGALRGRFCFDHKLDGMVIVSGPSMVRCVAMVPGRCMRPECCMRPSFNVPDAKKALFCRTHKEEGMVSV